MEIDQALVILSEVCANAQTTLAQHQTIQQALATVKNACTNTATPGVTSQGKTISKK